MPGVQLNEQIAKTFKATGAVSEAKVANATPPAARICGSCCAGKVILLEPSNV